MPRAGKGFERTLTPADQPFNTEVVTGNTGAGGTVAVAHGLGFTPTLAQAQNDFRVIPTAPAAASAITLWISAVDATNITVVGTASSAFRVVRA